MRKKCSREWAKPLESMGNNKIITKNENKMKTSSMEEMFHSVKATSELLCRVLESSSCGTPVKDQQRYFVPIVRSVSLKLPRAETLNIVPHHKINCNCATLMNSNLNI